MVDRGASGVGPVRHGWRGPAGCVSHADKPRGKPTMRPSDASATLTAEMQQQDDDPFEDWVIEAIDALPVPFRERLGSVAIVIEEEPTQAQLASVKARGLYGLYQGVPRSAWSADHSPWPSKITIFRGPLVRGFRSQAARRTRVIDTVHHEIAHHFGISDARLEELKRARR
jgi:predicted Zn-dependent protease with MMP-like domain